MSAIVYNVGTMKKIDVLVLDDVTGITVWADPGNIEIIRAVPGVAWVGSDGDTRYRVHLDPRYDKECISHEIYHQIVKAMKQW